MRNENPTVYTTSSGRVCEKCGKPVSGCVCKSSAKSIPDGDGVIRIFRDSKGRNGKSVTLVTGIPLAGEELRNLAASLKKLCGTGGTIKDGQVEIQGNHRETIFDFLKTKGYKVKIAGG
jgi:translation initiation factor 1